MALSELQQLVHYQTCLNLAMSQSRIIVALDYPDAASALAFADLVTADACRLKIGKELFTAEGPDLVRKLVDRGFDIFLDLKFHDIPNTVNKAVAAASRLGVWMVNVHAMGGQEMMQAAREATESVARQSPFLIAVSILTSSGEQQLKQIGMTGSVEENVIRLTKLALESGVDGMVCSAREASVLRRQFGAQPLLVTPGIRPAGASSDDQQRIMTPQQAIEAGSSYLVIGRPITQHQTPLQELQRINQSLQ
jgi:orotidine-5'-phosphate decarboxylase